MIWRSGVVNLCKCLQIHSRIELSLKFWGLRVTRIQARAQFQTEIGNSYEEFDAPLAVRCKIKNPSRRYALFPIPTEAEGYRPKRTEADRNQRIFWIWGSALGRGLGEGVIGFSHSHSLETPLTEGVGGFSSNSLVVPQLVVFWGMFSCLCCLYNIDVE